LQQFNEAIISLLWSWDIRAAIANRHCKRLFSWPCQVWVKCGLAGMHCRCGTMQSVLTLALTPYANADPNPNPTDPNLNP